MVQESVEGFREHLAKLQNMKGLTSEEKGIIMYNLYVWIYGIMYLKIIIPEYICSYMYVLAVFMYTIDPEEFLNLLFKHVLHLEPFITIRYVAMYL